MTVLSPRTRPDDVEGIERVPWHELGPQFIATWGRPNGRFDPEHLTVYGPSGSGKSAFLAWSVRARNRARGSLTVLVATKPADRTIKAMGWPVITRWPPDYGKTAVVYSAKAKGIGGEHLAPQRFRVKELMNALWRPDSNVVVVWDELPYLERRLRLGPELETYYREGRALGITNGATMQRPAGVSRLAHSEAGWAVAFKPRDIDDRKRVAQVFGDQRRYMDVLGQLDAQRHEFVIRHGLTGEAYVSHIPPGWLPGRRVVTAARSNGVRSHQQ